MALHPNNLGTQKRRMKTPPFVLYVLFLCALATVAPAADFSFSGPTDPNPYQLGAFSESTNTFSVGHQTAPPYQLNGVDFADAFSFSLRTDSIITLTGSPVLNLTGLGGLNIYELPAYGLTGSAAPQNPGDTIVLTMPLAAGSYQLNVAGAVVPGSGMPVQPIYEFTYAGTISFVTLPVLSIGNASVIVGQTGTTNATFTVSLSKPCSQPVSAIYTTANGSAIAGTDYQSISAYVAFAPGQTNRTISVDVSGGGLAGPEADFFVNLSAAAVGNLTVTLANAQGTGTIINADFPPVFQSVTQTNGTVQLSWSILPGQTYQLQSNTGLSSTNWVNLGGSVTATTTNASATDPMTNAQCFYRIRLF
jgi:hypothetical protein